MSSQLDVGKIVARNRRIDKKQFEQVMSLLNLLRDSGIKPVGYNLRPPFGRAEKSREQREHARNIPLRP